MQNNKVSVFIPNSFLAETKDLKLKTSKVGLIGRALALFEVDEVVVYKDLSIPDSEQTEDGDPLEGKDSRGTQQDPCHSEAVDRIQTS